MSLVGGTSKLIAFYFIPPGNFGSFARPCLSRTANLIKLLLAEWGMDWKRGAFR